MPTIKKSRLGDTSAKLSIKAALSDTMLRTWQRKIDEFSQQSQNDADRLEELAQVAESQVQSAELDEEGRAIIVRRAAECSRMLSEMQNLINTLDPRP